MGTRLGLIKNDGPITEKRVFPRFPFTSLIFKPEGEESAKVFEVRDISYHGMQVARRDGGHPFIEGSGINGELHWRGKELKVRGKVAWTEGARLGVSFEQDDNQLEEIKNFLSLDNILSGLKPLHSSDLGLDVPTNLKYWLKADGPAEIFVWQHKDGELARFQMILMDQFVEWEDGKGLKTGAVVKTVDKKTPLTNEDEFTLEIDTIPQKPKVDFAKRVIEKLNEGMIPNEAHEFLRLKLGS